MIKNSPLDGLQFNNTKTPITYYGGKQRMVKLILSLIPKHKLYCEPFVGGAAVFFSKDKSEIEVINDIHGEVVNFYRTCHTKFNKLAEKVASTPHSRQVHIEAREILKKPAEQTEINRAWAFWVQTNMSFSSKIFGGYAYERKSNGTVKRFLNKKKNFLIEIKNRLDLVDIENNDALQVIKSRDTEDSFFYCDPPYFNSNMGHYGGYSENDFEALLILLTKIKGKFLLSSYPSNTLSKYTHEHQWFKIEKTSTISASKRVKQKQKTEVLTANYQIQKEGLTGIPELALIKGKAVALKFHLRA